MVIHDSMLNPFPKTFFEWYRISSVWPRNLDRIHPNSPGVAGIARRIQLEDASSWIGQSWQYVYQCALLSYYLI